MIQSLGKSKYWRCHYLSALVANNNKKKNVKFYSQLNKYSTLMSETDVKGPCGERSSALIRKGPVCAALDETELNHCQLLLSRFKLLLN